MLRLEWSDLLVVSVMAVVFGCVSVATVVELFY
jgi:hypothetical protein